MAQPGPLGFNCYVTKKFHPIANMPLEEFEKHFRHFCFLCSWMESEKRYVGFMEPVPSSSINATSYNALVAGTWPGSPVNEITDPGPAALPQVVDNNDFAGLALPDGQDLAATGPAFDAHGEGVLSDSSNFEHSLNPHIDLNNFDLNHNLDLSFDFNQLPDVQLEDPLVLHNIYTFFQFVAAAPEENGMVTTESSHDVHAGVGSPADENAPVAQSAAQAALQLPVQPVTPPVDLASVQPASANTTSSPGFPCDIGNYQVSRAFEEDVSAACSTAPQENATTVTDDGSSAQRIMPTSTATTQLTPQSVAPTSPHMVTPRAAPSINAISQQNATTTAASPDYETNFPTSVCGINNCQFKITSGKNDAISAYFLGEHVMTHYPELAFTPSAKFVCPIGVSYEGKTCQNRKTEPCKTLREWQRAIGRHWTSYHYTTGPRFACRNPNCHFIADTGRRGMFFREDPRSKHESYCASVIRARARGEPDPPPPAKTSRKAGAPAAKKTTSRKSKGKGVARATVKGRKAQVQPVASSSGTQAA